MDNAVQILVDKHNEISEEQSSLNRLNSEVSFLSQFIPRFFSENGEATAIRNMYSLIEKEPERRILCSDVYSISSIYKEYIRGMIAFISDVNQSDSNNISSIESFREKFVRAKENDSKFINALYDGKIGEKKEVPLQEAVTNIEYLIDLIPYMKSIDEKCKRIENNKLVSTNKAKLDLVNECTNLLYDSIRNYCFITTREILDTFYGIQKVLNENEETENSKFVLF